VGGHCIPKDPWLLAYGAKDSDISLRVIPAARMVNDGMPAHIGKITLDALARINCDAASAKILILGYAYLENSDDDRNSPTAELVRFLSEVGAEVAVHDPHVLGYRGDLSEMAKGRDAVILMVSHSAYDQISQDSLNCRLVVDGRGFWRGNDLGGEHLYQYSLGVGTPHPPVK